MLKLLVKRWPIISILLTLAILACLLFWPNASFPLALGLMLVSIVMGIIFTIQKHVRAYRKGQLDRSSTFRNIFVDELGSLITIVAAILVAGRVAQAVGMVARRAAESQWVGTGTLVGILAALAVGILIGVIIGLLMKSTWGRLVKRPRAVAGENGP